MPNTTTPHPGPYTKELLEGGLPDYALLVGPSRVAEVKPVVWDLFELEGSHGDLDEASSRIGLPVLAQEPEADGEASRSEAGMRLDDLDAALSYLRQGGALCKVPDHPGSKWFRLLVVPFPGDPVRGNCN